MAMPYPKEVLDEIKWRYGNHDLEDVTIRYVSRGMPDDTGSMAGMDISATGPGGIELKNGNFIPYHRILSITYKGKSLFQRE